VADLQAITASMAAAARAAGVQIVTGDTKVVQKGLADGCYINTAGVGVIERAVSLGAGTARPGDAVLVSGPVGDHGITIMLARGELYVASEGRLVAIVDGAEAQTALAAMRSHPLGEGAAIIGTVKDDPPTLVLLKTEFGGTRIVDMLIGDPLPRIC